MAWLGGPVIGGINTVAMVVNFLFAGLAGTFHPIGAKFLGR